jgi:hypothetical protein
MSDHDPAYDEALRNEIQAAIAAGREVGPDMDKHLADSVLERYRQEQAARAKALTPQLPAAPPATASNGENFARVIVTLAGMAVFLAIIFKAPEFWWLIFVLPGLFGLWGWNHWGGRHDDRRDRIRERRRARRNAPPIEQA